MTELYFIRHCQLNYENHDDLTRELSPKGQADTGLVTGYLRDKNISAVLSSPFKRAVDSGALCPGGWPARYKNGRFAGAPDRQRLD